jgi:hypothetical protein
MASVQIPNLPPVISLSGAEQLEVVQAGVSSRATVQQIAQLFVPQGVFVTQNQMRTWLATNGIPAYIYAVSAACPADVANSVNIQWLHGNAMYVGDPLYLFIQSTLGFSAATMLASFYLMRALPA